MRSPLRPRKTNIAQQHAQDSMILRVGRTVAFHALAKQLNKEWDRKRLRPLHLPKVLACRQTILPMRCRTFAARSERLYASQGSRSTRRRCKASKGEGEGRGREGDACHKECAAVQAVGEALRDSKDVTVKAWLRAGPTFAGARRPAMWRGRERQGLGSPLLSCASEIVAMRRTSVATLRVSACAAR